MSFRWAGFARGICCFLEAEKKSRSLASLGMTKSTFSAACEAVSYKDLMVLTQTLYPSVNPLLQSWGQSPRPHSVAIDPIQRYRSTTAS